jgi:hypothetical protein
LFKKLMVMLPEFGDLVDGVVVDLGAEVAGK